jgi:hypothetical protein
MYMVWDIKKFRKPLVNWRIYSQLFVVFGNCYRTTAMAFGKRGHRGGSPRRHGQGKLLINLSNFTVHRQNVEVTNAEWTQRRTTKRRIGHNSECQNVE